MGRTGATARASEQRNDPYQNTACGLDDVWLEIGYDVEEIDGEAVIIVRKLDALHRTIGRFLVRRKKRLGGKEILFLKK